ncbi:hypothetical protein E0H75_04575 [Kribbella capetownensis]|uniref:Uncharacterized protein n=1 Tax=Kribbella capetownensis TaxID=1572659 RepID=A0A4R0K518_9ACTN|nr:hypothetical protein [Kribbella capetownensis]TCC53016.1 hypothetical protein E0H75_04575 [Kribbella capetownensis]
MGDLARSFVAQLNANNPTAATALACRSAKQVIPFLMRQYLYPPTRLTTATTPIGAQVTFVVQVSGYTKGAKVPGAVVIQQLSPSRCASVPSRSAQTERCEGAGGLE